MTAEPTAPSAAAPGAEYADTASTAYQAALQVIESVEPRIADCHSQRACRPTGFAQADRQRELRLAGRAADHGHLAVRQVRRGHHRTPVLRRLPERRHRRERRGRARRANCSALRTPTSSPTPASMPTSSRTGRSWPPASRLQAWRTSVPSTSTTCPRRTGRRCAPSWATSGCWGCRWTPAATSPTASGRTSPARCSTSASTAPTRRPACWTTARSRTPPASSSRWSSSPAIPPIRVGSTSRRCARSPTRSAPR